MEKAAEREMNKRERLTSTIIEPGRDQEAGLVLCRTADVGLAHGLVLARSNLSRSGPVLSFRRCFYLVYGRPKRVQDDSGVTNGRGQVEVAVCSPRGQFTFARAWITSYLRIKFGVSQSSRRGQRVGR